MKRLGFYPGEWTYTETYPNGAVNHGTYTSKLGPGGNSLLNTFHSQGPVGDFEGMLVYTWDLTEGKYKAYVFGNDFPGALIQTGEFEGEKLVLHGELGGGQSPDAERYMDGVTRKADQRDVHEPRGHAGEVAGAGGSEQAVKIKISPRRRRDAENRG